MSTSLLRRSSAVAAAALLAVSGALLAAAPAAAAGPYDDLTVIASGHVDLLYATQNAGATDVVAHTDSGNADPASLLFHVKPSVAQRTANAFVANGIPGFTTVGSPIYVLPQNSVPNTIFAGFGHNLPAGSSVTHTLTGLEGPGNLAAWQSGEEGPSVFWNSTVSGSAFTSQANHEHLNWGFSALGEYKATVSSVATVGGTALTADSNTYTFYVGEDLPVDPVDPVDPEPTSVSVSGLSGHYHAGGVLALTAVTDPVQEHPHVHWFTKDPGSTEWVEVEGAGVTLGAIVRTADNGREYKVVAYGASHEVVGESAPVTVVVDDHGNSPVEGAVITATLPENAGSLVVSVAPENSSVDLGEFALNAAADRYTASGELGAVTVTDTRAEDAGWTASGRVRGFVTADGERLAGGNLGWAPKVLSASEGQVVAAGAAKPSVLSGGAGVAAWSPLGSAAAGEGRGTAQLGAELVLEAPTTIGAGTYQGLMILTVV